jgi:hypothetical protein
MQTRFSHFLKENQKVPVQKESSRSDQNLGRNQLYYLVNKEKSRWWQKISPRRPWILEEAEYPALPKNEISIWQN